MADWPICEYRQLASEKASRNMTTYSEEDDTIDHHYNDQLSPFRRITLGWAAYGTSRISPEHYCGFLAW
jgi:hypothetical protein